MGENDVNKYPSKKYRGPLKDFPEQCEGCGECKKHSLCIVQMKSKLHCSEKRRWRKSGWSSIQNGLWWTIILWWWDHRSSSCFWASRQLYHCWRSACTCASSLLYFSFLVKLFKIQWMFSGLSGRLPWLVSAEHFLQTTDQLESGLDAKQLVLYYVTFFSAQNTLRFHVSTWVNLSGGRAAEKCDFQLGNSYPGF